MAEMNKIKVGITGQDGFMGAHLRNFFEQRNEEIEFQPFERSWFREPEKLIAFTQSCDAIVHLAGVNRHADPDTIFQTNVELAQSLMKAVDQGGSSPHIVFSSSTQEERGTIYGESKKEARRLFEAWAGKGKHKFTGLVIPNVFGPFGRPGYNSVIATFCHALTHGEAPHIDVDAPMKLIHVNSLNQIIYDTITNPVPPVSIELSHDAERSVSEVLQMLESYKAEYLDNNIIPELPDNFAVDLFNTFRSYIDENHYPVALELNADNRGHLIEAIKTRCMGQVFYSSTNPGITRGNHYHTRKIERFCVVNGDAIIQLRRLGTDEVIEYEVSGETPVTIDMPVFYTHNITNCGDTTLLTLFWSNEFFDPEDSDTYFQLVVPPS